MESGQSFIQSAILWSAMMTAMMLPPSLPMLQAVRRVSLDLWLSWTVVLGLVGVWLGFSLVLAAMQWGGHRLVAGDFPAWITPLLPFPPQMVSGVFGLGLLGVAVLQLVKVV